MNDDMKRLCEAAETIISEFGEDFSPGSLAAEVTRAVLTALREPSSDVLFRSQFGLPKQASLRDEFAAVIDQILAE
jgi:hypothetical protein